MIDRKREIFIRLEEVSNIIEILTEIKKKEDLLKSLFKDYDNLNSQENKIFENWRYYLEDLMQKLDHVTL